MSKHGLLNFFLTKCKKLQIDTVTVLLPMCIFLQMGIWKVSIFKKICSCLKMLCGYIMVIWGYVFVYFMCSCFGMKSTLAFHRKTTL